MALVPSVWGPAVATAVAAITPPAGTPISPAQIAAIWVAITTAHDTHISANAAVAGTVTSGAGTGGAVVGTVT